MKKKAPVKAVSAFDTIEFLPLTKQREVAAVDMGLKFGFVTNYVRQFLLRDTIVTLWLCTIPAEGAQKWTVDRAEREPDAARKQAYKWAEQMGIGIGSETFAKAQSKFIKFMTDVREAKGIAVMPHNAKEEDPSGELSATL